MNRWNSLDQETVDVGSMNSFKGRLDKIRKTRMGFLWILHGPLSPRPHGDRTSVRPHKVSHKVSQRQCHQFGEQKLYVRAEITSEQKMLASKTCGKQNLLMNYQCY